MTTNTESRGSWRKSRVSVAFRLPHWDCTLRKIAHRSPHYTRRSWKWCSVWFTPWTNRHFIAHTHIHSYWQLIHHSSDLRPFLCEAIVLTLPVNCSLLISSILISHCIKSKVSFTRLFNNVGLSVKCFLGWEFGAVILQVTTRGTCNKE